MPVVGAYNRVSDLILLNMCMCFTAAARIRWLTVQKSLRLSDDLWTTTEVCAKPLRRRGE